MQSIVTLKTTPIMTQNSFMQIRNKAFLFSYLVLFLSTSAYSQTEQQVEARILRDFGRMNKLREKKSDKATDSLEMINHKLLRYLVKACINNPKLLKAPFKGVPEEQMNILSSEDGAVRIYNWDTQRGGA